MLDIGYRPFFPLSQLQDDLGDIFDRAFAPAAGALESART